MQSAHHSSQANFADTEGQYPMLKFATFTTEIELSFYVSLASHKINHDKLDDSTRRVVGIYEIKSSDVPAASCRMQVRGNALTSDEVTSNCYRADGSLKNYNTIEEYRKSEKGVILDRAARTVWDAICDGTIFSCPSLLSSFHLIFFSDLKKYKFTYLCGYPAFRSEPSWKLLPQSSADQGVIGNLSAAESIDLVGKVQTWRYSVDSRQWGFFLAKKMPRTQDTPFMAAKEEPEPEYSSSADWIIGSLGEYENGFFEGIPSSERFICFADPSTYAEHPGWPLRNLLALVKRRWNLDHVQVICYRDTHARRHEARSLVLSLRCINVSGRLIDNTDVPKVTGWERNSLGKVVSRIARLEEYLDPRKLADQAVDLNLKLIKWRLAPTLDLEIIKNASCLLLGSGTLGSYVSRNLMGWGVKTITFVDNGTVSFSNPVRQPLFNFEDCLGGGVGKAERAAAALREIYPGVNARGFNLSVPMLGHPVLDESRIKEDYETLHRLFSEHDVIFLLMDTRESRWLPTVMGKAMGKLVMNAALGFDNYVVMRHGGSDTKCPEDELGCYFCNDVVAPADSMSDRTLDQQCTVTRPGVAAIASALLVELMVSVLQEHGMNNSDTMPPLDHPLGDVPHTIRGFLSRWDTLKITGKAYNQCSACSSVIVHEYQTRTWDFVRQALNEKDYVAELSGLAELQRQTEYLAADLEWDEEGGDLTASLDEEGELL